MTLHCRVTRVNMERFQLDLTCRSSDLADKEGKFRYMPVLEMCEVDQEDSFLRQLPVIFSRSVTQLT